MNCSPQPPASPKAEQKAWKKAQFNYASGNSCEQAIFAAFASDMGLSLIGAQQTAPKRKDRGTGCGALISGIAILETLESKRRAEQNNMATENEPVRQPVLEFQRSFLAQYGTTECKAIQGSRKGLSDCMDVIGWTTRCIELLIEKLY